MTTVVRKFGTDLSNIKRDPLSPKKRAIKKNFASGNKKSKRLGSLSQSLSVAAAGRNTQETVDIINKENEVISGLANLSLPISPVRSPESAPTPTATPSEDLQKVISQSDKGECTVEEKNTTAPSDMKFRYSIEFLLNFKEFFTEPMEDLLPEVRKDNVSAKWPQSYRANVFGDRAPLRSFARRALFNDNNNYRPAEIGATSFTPCTDVASTEQKPASSCLEAPTQKMDVDQSTQSSAVSSHVIKLEWKPKKVKKEKAKEVDERRIAQRQKQLDIGKNTPGYARYLEAVPKNQRKKGDPKTPNKYQVCSKRSWDGQVRKWRRQLHVYDPPGLADSTADQDLDDCEEGGDEEQEDSSDVEEVMKTEQIESNSMETE